jgi:serine phosphatase RsbU (regulator of sigma subunit)
MEIWGGHGSVFDAVSAPGMDAWVLSRPHDGGERGGDVHYLSGCAAGHVLRVALADVAGHGESVGDVARTLRGLMRKSINTPDQSALVREMNREFVGRSTAGVFATAVLATYLAPERTLLFVNAGHPRPLLSRNGGAWQTLDGDHPDVKRRADDAALRNLPLGVLEGTGYEQLAVRLGVGDRVLLYTDFAVEARSSSGDELGEQGLVRLLSEIETGDAEFLPALLERIGAHRSGEDAGDDATLVLLRHNESPMPPQRLGDRARTLARLIGLLPV